MADTIISAQYPPQIDITRTPLAYGDRALPRLVSLIHVYYFLQRLDLWSKTSSELSIQYSGSPILVPG